MPQNKLIRGTHIVPLLQHVQSTYDAETKQTIYGSLTDTTRTALGQLDSDVWYPASIVAEVNRCIFNAHGDPSKGYAAVRETGAAIAEYGVNTFMRLLIKLMTPEMLAKKWPTIWGKSHNFGHMKTEMDSTRDRWMSLTLSEVEDYSHIGPCVVGFISFSLKAMGRSQASVVEPNLDWTRETAASYSFEVTW